MTIKEKVEKYLAQVYGTDVTCRGIRPRKKDGRYVATIVDENGGGIPMLTPFRGSRMDAIAH